MGAELGGGAREARDFWDHPPDQLELVALRHRGGPPAVAGGLENPCAPQPSPADALRSPEGHLL